MFAITFYVLLFKSLSSPGQQSPDRSGIQIERSGRFRIGQALAAKDEQGGLRGFHRGQNPSHPGLLLMLFNRLLWTRNNAEKKGERFIASAPALFFQGIER